MAAPRRRGRAGARRRRHFPRRARVAASAIWAPTSPMSGRMPPTLNIAGTSSACTARRAIEVSTRCVFTNTTPIGAYRGAGRPEGNYYHGAADRRRPPPRSGIDRLELRRQNLIRPDEMPYTAPSGLSYDSGDFTRACCDAGARRRRTGTGSRRAGATAAQRGKLRGRGIGCYLEVTAPPPARRWAASASSADGPVTIVTGTLDYGQGHASAVRPGARRRGSACRSSGSSCVQGDSDQLIARRRHRRLAIDHGERHGDRRGERRGHREGPRDRRPCARGRRRRHRVRATAASSSPAPTAAIGLMELAGTPAERTTCRPELPRSLDVAHVHEGPPSAFPNGCHVAEVEIDPETGAGRGRQLHDGQRLRHARQPDAGRGAAATAASCRAIGQALMERTSYDDSGQLVSGLVHGLRAAARRERAVLPLREPSRPGRRPTRSASRAAARPAAPARCRRS